MVLIAYNNYMSLFQVDDTYSRCYTQGWDARMSDIYVNPYVYDFDSGCYDAWKHGWDDANIEIEVDNGQDERRSSL